MTKQEFLKQLRMNIASVDDATFINDTIAYYEDYIEKEVRHGKTESEVLKSLGNPRLIAKSILASYSGNTGSGSIMDDRNEFHGNDAHFKFKRFNMPLWKINIGSILVIFLFFIILFMILSSLAPFIVLGVLAYIIYKIVVRFT